MTESVLTNEEKFLFDLQGFLVIKGVLDPDECARLSRLADSVWPRQEGDGHYRRTGNVSLWHPEFLNLTDHPKLLPYLIELMGPRLRLDHDYCIFMTKHPLNHYLHGGPTPLETDHWYRYQDGVMRNGLTVATWALTDAQEGDGGFVCVPGSHKTNFLRYFPRDVAKHERMVDYVYQPVLAAGDVLIFTEALIHGTREWQSENERRTLLFKYSPPHSSWALKPYDLEQYSHATDQQKRLLAGPSVHAHPPVVQVDSPT
ncbi:MAG: phytanoyl-CoA dioxygenase family protein [Gammaproteobacteria bacterium]|nr:phytanoyl-CoA dioxygenase family protein [Gammaproteobacteria bacterium]